MTPTAGSRESRTSRTAWRRESDPTNTTSHAHTARPRARPYLPPRLRNGSFAHASRSGGQRNGQALHPALPSAPVLYSDWELLYTGRSPDHRNATGAHRASPARSVSPLVCGSDCLPASPPYACSSLPHASRSTGQRNTTQSNTVLARPVCPHVCDSDSARVTTSSSFSLCSAPSPPLPPPGSQPPHPPLSRGYLPGRGRSRPCRGGQSVRGGRCPVGPQAR